MPLRLGAYLGTDSGHILDWNQLSKLKSTDLFGGGWVISKYTKQPTPNKKKHILILTINDKSKTNKIPNPAHPLTAHIFNCPSTISMITSDSLLVISPNKGHIKEFNHQHTICANYDDILIVPPHNFKQYYTSSPSQSRSPTPRKRKSSSCSPMPKFPISRSISKSPLSSKSPIPKYPIKYKSPRSPSVSKSPMPIQIQSQPTQKISTPPAQKPFLQRIPTETLSDLSSPSSDNEHASGDIERKKYPTNPTPTQQEILQSSLGIDDSLAIAYDKKIVYNYAAQQIDAQRKTQSEIINDMTPEISSGEPMTSPTNIYQTHKRSFKEMNGYNGDDEIDDENITINMNVEGPSPKKQKISNEKSQSTPVVHKLTAAQKLRIEKNRLAAIERLKLHKVNTEVDRIYVVDLETTSFPPKVISPDNDDVIIEIAIVQFNRMESKLYNVKPIFHCFIHPETYDKYPENWRDAWIFKHGTAVDMVETCGLNAKLMLPQIRKILKGNYVTSFNAKFDLQTFLNHKMYNMECKSYECIMKISEAYMNLKMPALEDAAHHFFGPDFKWGFHNAMEDALTAAKILSQVVTDSR